MEYLPALLLFAVGVLFIVKGGDYFVDAASWIAEVSGIPKFVVGATIVSLATTLPELLVSSIAAYEGKVDMAIGNAVGSVAANTGLILGISLLFMPVAIRRKQLAPKGLLLMATIGALWLVAGNGSLSVGKSVVLFVIFGVFLLENVLAAKAAPDALSEERPARDRKTVCVNLAKFVFGTAGIVIGSQLLVDKGSLLARVIGIPESIIGLTAIAIGTSLPELVTTITAIRKKESSLSVGNILGANIIDTALILPVCAVISGGSIPVSAQNLAADIPVTLLLAGLAIIPALMTKKFHRWQGALCIAVYLGYLGVVCL